MARDNTGTFNLPAGNPVITNTVIESVWANTTMAEVAAALTDSLSRSGKGGMSAPLDMGGNRVVAVAPAQASTDAPNALQLRDTTFNRLLNCTSGSTGNDYNGVATIVDPIVNGTLYLFVADKANTGPMTLVVNGGAQIPILMNGGPVPPGIIESGTILGVIFLDGAWRVTNTAGIVDTINEVQSDNLDAISVTNNASLAVATLNIHANVPRGLAQLDANSKFLASQMPFSTLSFIGSWDATSGALPPTSGVANGSVYLIVAPGTLMLYRPDAPGSNNYTQQATVVNVNDQILFKTPASTGQPVGWYYSPAPSGTATAANVSLIETSATPPFGGITNVQSWLNQGDVQIRNKLPLAGGALTGDVTQSAAPATPTSLVTKQYVIDTFTSIPPNVSSFGSPPRTGPVVLLPADVTAALGYTPVDPAAPNFATQVTAPSFSTTGLFTGKAFTQSQYEATVTGAYTADYLNGQSQILTVSPGPVTISPANVPKGSILRLVLIGVATNVTVVWNGSTVAWPLGSPPDLSLGPLKKAIVVMEWDGAKYLATSSAF
jgi:hypothetical protein